ncbi:MAG: hypothetical protein ABH871_07235 [Pseudomonadota bacterium]
MKRILLVALLLGYMLNTSFAIDPGRATGTLKVGKHQIELKHAYAHKYNNEEELLNGPELRILLTDQEVPQELLSGYDALMRIDGWVREGKVRGVLIKLDPKNPSAGMSGTLLFRPAKPKSSLISFISSGQGGVGDFMMGNNRVGGKAAYKSESQGFSKDIPPFEFFVSFSAPLFHDEKITAKLTGAKAAKSAPAQALIAYYKALSLGDFEPTQNSPINERWKTDPLQLEQKINRVFIRGARAVVILQEDGEKSAQSMIQKNGVWKVN